MHPVEHTLYIALATLRIGTVRGVLRDSARFLRAKLSLARCRNWAAGMTQTVYACFRDGR